MFLIIENDVKIKSGQSKCLLTTSIIVVIPAFVGGKHPKSGHFEKTQFYREKIVTRTIV